MKVSMGAMSKEHEREMIDRYICDEPLNSVEVVCDIDEIVQLQKEVREVFVHDDLRDYIVELVQGSRVGAVSGVNEAGMTEGISPRGTLALLRASQGYALVMGRDYVVPEDIKAVAVSVLAHRLICEEDDYSKKINRIEELLQKVAVPTEDWKRR